MQLKSKLKLLHIKSYVIKIKSSKILKISVINIEQKLFPFSAQLLNRSDISTVPLVCVYWSKLGNNEELRAASIIFYM